MPARRKQLPPNVSAERVRSALNEAHPAGLHLRQLIAATDLTESRVRRGIAFLRDVASEWGMTPLIWDRKRGYRFSKEPTDWIAYETGHFRYNLGRFRRFIAGCVLPHKDADPTSKWATLVLKQLSGAESAFEVLVEYAEAQATDPPGNRRKTPLRNAGRERQGPDGARHAPSPPVRPLTRPPCAAATPPA